MLATAEQCEQALRTLAGRLAGNGSTRATSFDRTLACTLSDLDLTYAGRLKDGQLSGITVTSNPSAQIRLTMASDDLLELVDGRLDLGSAWASGRIKIDAGLRDLLRLRTLF
jgi:hypothetical protein